MRQRLAFLAASALVLVTPAVASAPGPVYTQAYRLQLELHWCPEDAYKFIPGVNSAPGYHVNPPNRVLCVPMDGGRVIRAPRRGGIG